MKFDVDAAALYAKKGCKHCHGRGYIVVEKGTVRRGETAEPYVSYCRCVWKNKRKYG